MTYRFEKLYVDLVAADGAVCIVYVAQTAIAGRRLAHAGVEWYEPDGRRAVWRARVVRVDQASPGPGGGLSLRLMLPDGVFSLDVEGVYGAWDPGVIREGLHWSVLQARADGSACLPGERPHGRLQGTGYVERVILHRLPRRFGLARIDWGRCQGPGHTLVFNRVGFRDGTVWQRAARWSAQGFTEGPFGLQTAGDLTRLVLPEEEVTLRPLRCLRAGPALDPQRFPNPLARGLAYVAAGPVQERRWLSRVEGTASWMDPSARAVHECVRFSTT